MIKGLRKRLAIIFTVFTGAVLTAALGISFYQVATQANFNAELWFSSTVDRVASTVMTNTVSQEPLTLYAGDYVVYVTENGQPLEGLLAETDEAAAAVPALSIEDQKALFVQARTIAEERGLTSWITESYQVFSAYFQESIEADSADFTMRTDEGVSAAIMGENYIAGTGSLAIAVSPVVGTEGIFDMKYEGNRYRATYFNWEMQSVPAGQTYLYEVAVMENMATHTRQLVLSGLWYAALWLAGLVLLFIVNWFLAKLVLKPTADGLRHQSEFVAAASHELRSPLAVIRSSLSAAEEAADDAGVEKFRAAAAEEAGRMSHLVDDLLLLAGGDAGSWQLQKAPVDLDTLLIGTAESYTPMARDKGLRLKLELPEETLPKVQGDAERLRQILAVLLDNALQFAPEDTEITLSAAAKKGRVNITVADRGRGVPDEEKDKVFERFYQVDKSRHSKAHFGLGLSVARELAELHKGRLTVGDTEDGGASFTLMLPAG